MAISLEKLKSLATINFKPILEDFTRESEHFDPELLETIQNEILEKYDCCYPNPLWFCAKVTASFAGIESKPEYLGCCSYGSYEEFTSERDAYYLNMKDDAICSLFQTLMSIHSELQKLEEC